MKILIDIPKAIEVDYNADRFADFFQRCLADMGTCCGNYEQETADMMEKAFAESRLYDPDKVVEQLEKEKEIHKQFYNISVYKDMPEIKERYRQTISIIDKTIEIVKAGGTDGN